MTTIRHKIQEELFQPSDEKIISVCHVGKFLKKKKVSFLCVVSTISKPVNVSIVQVKQSDKYFKRKRSWTLAELKTVDGKDEAADTAEFDLYMADKVYHWVASSIPERQNFIISLYKQSNKYFTGQRPMFRNVPKSWVVEEELTPESINFASSPLMGLDNDLSEDFQAITDKEQEDLSKLMGDCEFAISNAEAFMEVLARDLSMLDGENVQCVLASEAQVESLMQQLELAINEAEKIENRLDSYDAILRPIRDTMKNMEKKNMMIEVADRNNSRLLQELEKIVTQLNLPQKYETAIEDADLTTPQGLRIAVEAGNALRKAMNSQLNPAILELAAVQEQIKKFNKLKDKFSRTINRQLNNLFIHYGNHKGEGERTLDGLILPQHSAVHKELNMYTELMHWTKIMDADAYQQLRKVYTDSLGKLYERDLRHLFEAAKEKVAVSGPVTTPTRNTTLLGLDKEQWSCETEAKDRHRYDSTLEQVLSLLEPVCLQEQQFCVSFFQLDILNRGSKNTLANLDGSDEQQAIVDKKAEKQIHEDVRNMMSSLFSGLEEELVSFIGYIEKQDAFYCMYVLVRLNQHVMSAQSSFLSNTFASVLIQIKRSLDRFMQTQIQSIQECKMRSKAKGILPYVTNLEEFARNADVLLRSERRADLEKWYTRLVDQMIECIAVQANESTKAPSQVIKMENYHHLYSLLSQLKISVLDAQRKEVKQRYNDALAAYVTLYFGKPLEKLNTFFDGVQARVASGVKAFEVSYQLAFSKQELRKVIAQYPGSTVKRGLESLFKKVEKHLSEDSNLLQVVWRAMQEEFIQQYKTLEDLIQQCYPGSMITLEFTINDILNFFSDIARSH